MYTRKDLQESLRARRLDIKWQASAYFVACLQDSVCRVAKDLTSSPNNICARVLAQMEEALQGAEECSCPLQCAAEVRSLAHLERHIDTASSSVVIIAFYSRVRLRHVQCMLPMPALMSADAVQGIQWLPCRCCLRGCIL